MFSKFLKLLWELSQHQEHPLNMNCTRRLCNFFFNNVFNKSTNSTLPYWIFKSVTFESLNRESRATWGLSFKQLDYILFWETLLQLWKFCQSLQYYLTLETFRNFWPLYKSSEIVIKKVKFGNLQVNFENLWTSGQLLKSLKQLWKNFWEGGRGSPKYVMDQLSEYFDCIFLQNESFENF
jgi:hypothetical protein